MIFTPNHNSHFDPDMSLDEMMRRWPETISVFMRQRMACVGCPIASFHTIGDAVTEYHLDETHFVEQLALARDGAAKKY